MPLLFHNFHIVLQYECFMIIMKTQVHENEIDILWQRFQPIVKIQIRLLNVKF